MLIPHTESNLSINILVLGSEIITLLKKKRNFILIEDVMKDFLKKNEIHTAELFIDILTFLYTIGFLDYDGYKIRLKKNDTT